MNQKTPKTTQEGPRMEGQYELLFGTLCPKMTPEAAYRCPTGQAERGPWEAQKKTQRGSQETPGGLRETSRRLRRGSNWAPRDFERDLGPKMPQHGW